MSGSGKSHRKNRLRWDIEYSNLHSLATCAIPSFYVLLEFEEDADTADNIYVKYVGEDFIRSVMRKLRVREVSDHDFKMNTKTMSIVFGEDNRLQNPNSLCLKDKLLQSIGSDYDACVVAKRKFLEGVGYEDGAASVEITLAGEENIQAFEDMLLGRPGNAAVLSFNVWESRFGLKSIVPKISSEGGTVEVVRYGPDWAGKLIIRPDGQGPSLIFSCSAFMSKEVPPSRLYVKTDYISIYITNSGMSSETSLSNDEELPLRLMLKNVKALSLLREEGCTVDLVPEGSTKLASLRLNPQAGVNSGTIKLLQYTKYVLDRFDFVDDVEVTYSGLRDHHERICQIYKLLDSRYHPVTVTLEVPGANGKVNAACIFLQDVTIGRYQLLGFFSVEGVIREGGLVTGRPTLLESKVRLIDDTSDAEAFETLSRIMTSYPPDVFVHAPGLTSNS